MFLTKIGKITATYPAQLHQKEERKKDGWLRSNQFAETSVDACAGSKASGDQWIQGLLTGIVKGSRPLTTKPHYCFAFTLYFECCLDLNSNNFPALVILRLQPNLRIVKSHQTSLAGPFKLPGCSTLGDLLPTPVPAGRPHTSLYQHLNSRTGILVRSLPPEAAELSPGVSLETRRKKPNQLPDLEPDQAPVDHSARVRHISAARSQGGDAMIITQGPV